MNQARALVGAIAALIAVTACSEVSPSGCPVTDPNSMAFDVPAAYPTTPSDPDMIWFGSPSLWTVMPTDGTYEIRKSVWWSVDFAGGAAEPMPEITVTYERLNSHAEPVVFVAPGTNGTTEVDGAFMVNGIDQEAPGCWRVTAEYRDASLSYTYELGQG